MSDIEERMAPPAAVRRWAVWGGRGAASLADQAMFAGTHFVINVMLARWLPLEEYGLFAVAYSVMVFANFLHTSTITEPIAIFWAHNVRRRDVFLREALSLNLAFAVICVVAVVIGTGTLAAIGALSSSAIFIAIMLAITLPFFWFLRQLPYADMRPRWAVFSTAAYATVFVGGSIALRVTNALDGATALLMMGGASLAGALVATVRYRARPAPVSSPETRRLFGQAWSYGAWAAPTSALIWLANNIYFFLLPIATSIADAGRLKMVLNILVPFQQGLLGASLVALPALARLNARGQAERAARLVRLGIVTASVGGVLFGAALLLVGPAAFTLIYGTHHAGQAQLVFCGVALPMIWALIAVARVDLRARQNVRLIFFGYAVGGLLVGVPILPLVLPHGTPGALIGMTVMFAAVAATLLWVKDKSEKI